MSVGKYYDKIPLLPKNPLSYNIKTENPIFSIGKKVKLFSQARPFDSQIKSHLEYFAKNNHDLYAIQTPREIGNVLTFLNKIEKLDGDILELGIAKGGTTIMMAKYLDSIKSKKKIYACDCFEGLPYNDKHSTRESQDVKGDYCFSYETVSNQVKKYGVSDRIELVKGLFEDTLQQLSDNKFAYVLVDCDLYDATKHALSFIWPRMITNGVIQFDEYSDSWGEKKAVDEFCESNNLTVNHSPEPHILHTT